MTTESTQFDLSGLIQKARSTFGRLTRGISARSRGRGSRYGCRVDAVAQCPSCGNVVTSWEWHADQMPYESNGRTLYVTGMAETTFSPCGCVATGNTPALAVWEDPSAWELVDIKL